VITTCISSQTATFAPLVRNLSLVSALPPTAVHNFFGFPWPPGAPAGAHTFFVAFATPGTLNLITSAVVSVQYSP
jgi:hypothetical protein